MTLLSRHRISTAQRQLLAPLLPLLLLWAPAPAQAQASLPYTPSAAGRHALSLLVDDGGLEVPLTHWPVPARAVRQALDRWSGDRSAPRSAALEAARADVTAELDTLDQGRLSVTVARRADTLVGFDEDFSPGSGLRLRGGMLGAPSSADAAADSTIVARVGARLDADPGPPGQRRAGARARLDDSAVALEALGVQLQAATRSAWWGPGWRSNLILGRAAPDLATVSLQRAMADRSDSPWLSWMGPWSFEFFAAQTEVSDVEPAYPWLVGQRLTLRPFSGWEIGLSRTAQWGGRGNAQSARSFWHMLTGQTLNTGRAGTDAANELAGFDIRARCPAGWPCAVYTQWIGEDLSHYFPSHWLTLWGFELWDGPRRLTVEYADSTCDSSFNDTQRMNGCAYRNHIYTSGYVSNGRWLGASQGPDTRLLSVGWLDTDSRARLRVDYGLLVNRPAASPLYHYPYIASFGNHPLTNVAASPQVGIHDNGHLLSFSLERSLSWMGGDITPQLRWQQVSVPSLGRHRSASLGLNWSRSLGEASASSWPAKAWTQDHPLPTALALLAAGIALDKPADRYARDHGDNPSMKALRRGGDALPVLALGMAGSQWLLEHGSARGDTALAATTAGLGAYASSKLLKSAISRDRPVEGLGPSSFGHSGAPRADSSMPSNHAAIAWAVLTPYAQTYGQDWLYGLAALTSVSRVMGREHWASDVAAGSLLGYHLGTWSRTYLANGATVHLAGPGLVLVMPLP
ncbi:MAG: hypothetical protein RLY71_946 [Pseudomonadota bacterium]|jgi:hypothetical protein